tara:strand:+ start:3729 stop:4334 length:606 start_codon:yes stop_codon:yes gene_type:complete
MKRIVDIILSFLAIVILSPLILIISFCIYISMGRPVFFVQKRIGKSKKAFKLIKFRSMVNIQKKETITNVTTRNDPRITKLGKFLRKSKIDEIPGLFNVLIGHMSIVGPRPEVEEYISSLKDDEKIILSLRPGLTSPASLKFINEEKILSYQNDPEAYNKEYLYPEKTRMNIDYVNNYSIYGDIKIILLTTIKVIKNVFKR